MKRVAAALLCLVLLSGCAAQLAAGETVTVYVLTEYTTCLYPDGIAAGPSRVEYRYDEAGNTVEERYFNLEGKLSSRDSYTYNSAGKLVRHISYDYWWRIPIPSFRQTVTYDDQGRERERISYDPWKESARSVTVYDDDAHSRSTAYSYPDEEGFTQTVFCDENGTTLKIITLEASGSEAVTQYTYDEAGHLLNWRESRDGVLTEQVSYTYDEQGREHYTQRISADGNVTATWQYTYDGNTVTTEYIDSSTRVENRDERGNPVHSARYDADGILTSESTYTYQAIQVPVKK